jgi:hypothetical protein
MAALPGDEEQEALLAALGEIVATQGPERLLRGPLEPTPHFFPDRWRPDLDGARSVLRRVMAYAGLDDLACEIESGAGVTRQLPELPGDRSTHTAGAAAWFYGIADGVAWFGVDRRALEDPEQVVAALCHESAHAFRRRRGLEGDPETEELRTDVTTVFLGFGILTTNASSRMRTKGELVGSMVRHSWSHTSLGYLPPESMGFLLAAQAVVRRATWKERRRLAALLEPNQAASFHAACRRLRRDEAGLLRRLGVASDRRPLPPPEPSSQALTLPEATLPAGANDVAATATGGCAGKPVFRVPRASVVHSRRAIGLFLGASAGGIVAAAWGGGAWPPLLLAAAGAVAGHAHAMARRQYECSEPSCSATLTPQSRLCPGCGGEISGDIRRQDDRLEALERLRSGADTCAVAEKGRAGRRGRGIRVTLLASCCALVLIGWWAGLRPWRLLKRGPTVEVGCENDGWLGRRCAPRDRLGFRVASVQTPLYLAAYLSREGSSRRLWLFPEDDGSVPAVAVESWQSSYVLYVGIPELPPGRYRAVAMLFSHVPTRAEADAGTSAVDREEVTLIVEEGLATGGRVSTTRNARVVKPGDPAPPALR